MPICDICKEFTITVMKCNYIYCEHEVCSECRNDDNVCVYCRHFKSLKIM